LTNQLREMISLHHAVSEIDIVVTVVFSVELKLYFKRCDKHAKNRLYGIIVYLPIEKSIVSAHYTIYTCASDRTFIIRQWTICIID
jgi:hypothetical protein